MQRVFLSVVAGVLVLVCTFRILADELSDAEALFRAEKWNPAREIYEKLLPELSAEEAAEALHNIGYCFQRTHQHEKAVPVFERSLATPGITNERAAAVRLRLGYALRMVGKSDEAIDLLEKAASGIGAPANIIAEALLNAAWERNKLDQRGEALATFRRIEAIEGVHANYVASAQLNIGRTLQDRGEYCEAISEYQKIESLTPVAAVNRARARVYILECEALLAGDNPFHIKPYVSKVTGNAAKLFWVSQGEISAGMVTIRAGEATRTLAPEVTAVPDTICRLQAAQWDDLMPNTTYQYQVECGGETIEGAFNTAPDAAAPFTFCVIGDTQSYHPALQPLLDAMGKEESEFVLHVGDITDRGNMWGEWKAGFFDPGWGYLRHNVFWPVYGNHDGGPYFPVLFDLGRKWWYSFDWGNAHFIVLDSYGAGSGGPGRAEQLAWLKEDLEANDKPWTFAALHVPMVATRRSLKWFGAEDFLPLLEEHEVDIVFSGHHPHYRRYYPIGQQGKQPVLHITTGGGGGPVGGTMPSPVLALGIDVNHYTKVALDGNRLRLSAHAISGAVIDRFELTKESEPALPIDLRSPVDTAQAKEIISLYQELLTDRTHELHLFAASTPEGGQPVKLILDLARLPRGPLDAKNIPTDAELSIESTAGSLWKIPRQSVRLAETPATIEAEAPPSLVVNGRAVSPNGELTLELRIGGRAYEPAKTTLRVRAE